MPRWAKGLVLLQWGRRRETAEGDMHDGRGWLDLEGFNGAAVVRRRKDTFQFLSDSGEVRGGLRETPLVVISEVVRGLIGSPG